jgi:hypothetical protein
MEPQPLATPAHRTLRQLNDLIVDARARVCRHELALSMLPRGRLLVARARLAAAVQRLAQLTAERQRLRGGV